MKKSYRGYDLEAKRDRCLAGYDLLYYYICRQSDGYECVSSFEYSDETIEDKIKQLMQRVDNELKEQDPWDEKANDY